MSGEQNVPSGIPRQISEATLRQLYITENLSIREIARKLNTAFRSIQFRLQKFNIKKDIDKIDNTRISNMKKIMIFKYGTECYMTSKKGYQQYQNKLLQNYGITNIMQLESAKQNRAQTCIRKYGVDHDLKAKSVRDKMKQTLLSKYGVDNSFKSKELMANSLSKRKTINGYLGNGRHINTKFGIIFVRSSYEEKFLNILLTNPNVNSLKYEPFIIKSDEIQYTPDFLINNNILIEIKPYRFIFPNETDNKFVKKIASRNQIKHNIAIKWASEHHYKYYLITEKEISKEWCDQNLILTP
jgi:hypothetical protein